MLPVKLPAPLAAVFVFVDLVGAVVVLPAPLTAVLLEAGAVPAVAVGAVVLVGVLGVPLVATGALVPLAAVPEPLTVEASTVVDPDAFASPEPLFEALTVVEPAASVLAFVVLAMGVLALGLRSSTGAAVPLAAIPEPLTVAALIVVEPAALTKPEPLFVAFTVVEPEALVIAVCPSAEPEKVSTAAATAAATAFFR